jgi:Single-strand binding protein family
MNRVLLTGRLTRDPEMRVVTNGKNVTHFYLEYCRMAGLGPIRTYGHLLDERRSEMAREPEAVLGG